MSREQTEKQLLEKIQVLEESVRKWQCQHESVTRDLELLRAIVGQTRLPLYLKDMAGKYLLVNPEFERLSGVPLENLRGKTDFEVFPEPVARLFREQDAAVISAGGNLQFEETIPLVDGVHSFITEKFPVFDAQGHLCAVGGVCTDITQRKAMEMELAHDREHKAVTLRSLADGVITTDHEGRVLLMNRMAVIMTGFAEEEGRGNPLSAVFSPIPEGEENAAPVWETSGESEPASIPETYATLKSRGGNKRLITVTTAPLHGHDNQEIGQVVVFRDVTERRRLEHELLKARKLQSIQAIAGGIAHDFNNFLTSVLGNISLASALTRLTDGKAHQLLKEAERATMLAKKLTQQLLTFTKGGEPVKTVAALPEVIRDSASFLLRGSQTQCEFEIPEDVWPVEIDTGQMSQVIQNIILNASQAMSGSGVIRIRCENVHLVPGTLSGLSSSRFVRLTITDFGVGISTEIQERIFDPFFTTKPGGTGLGLAITHSIVARHNGRIDVQSQLGKGTTFCIHLPASDSSQAALAGEGAIPRGANLLQSQPTSCLPKVLVMDDDPFLRSTLQELLNYQGFQVVSCAEGSEAVRLFESHFQQGKPFDLVIMDLTIPGGMGGKEALKLVRKVDPGSRVVVSSGFSDDPILARYAEYGFSGVLPKPYRLEDLEELLQKVIPNSCSTGVSAPI